MKLFARYNRINVLTTVIVLFITGIIYYQAISYILNHQVDKDIKTEEQEILDYIGKYNSLPEPADSKYQQVKFSPLSHPIERQFVNSDFFNKKEQQYESGRGLLTSALVNGHYYQINITESKVETEDLITIVFMITIGVIVFLVLILFITNRFVLNRMWQPFYSMLNQLRLFNLSDGTDVSVAHSKIDEFNELNQAIVQMSSRVKGDYRDLKDFTENAAHELMTPIAVINSKLDTLLQTGEYNEPQSNLLTDVYGAVSRLSRLNQSLLLLVKIENKLLHDEQLIDFKPLIEEKIGEFKELFGSKEISVVCQLEEKQLLISRYLTEILLNNLISNAMRHNYYRGQILIRLTAEKLIIQNTGDTVALEDKDIFKRFNKSSGSEGTGLGLTISRQICTNYGLQFGYSFESPFHTFSLNFTAAAV
ncbi:sensor histidine kinase [Mucilaginibacter paludis]|uniref:histidine kinase n=1 Tax=Mucilaginibacter paludis DSM 18603 TaxID=714943 RepID=H1Y9X4_9SPHI|nr:HAMP domain-containing sensor histidine kinase [Mucilaginibacter paludis]EHQ31157.1 integral membrane sensor signal transduction histidine kinase [Mucilaginibacter paludis DSM 18603]